MPTEYGEDDPADYADEAAAGIDDAAAATFAARMGTARAEAASDECPLMSFEGKSGSKRIDYIKVTRLDAPPNSGENGYKGKLQASATAEGLARKFGNGVYKLEFCNAKHKPIETINEYEVSVAALAKPKTSQTAGDAMLAALGVVATQSTRHEDTQARTNIETMEAVSAMSDRMTTLMTEMTLAAREADAARYERERTADRERVEAEKNASATMWATLLTAGRDAAQAAQERSQASHDQTLQMMQASADREREAAKERAAEREAMNERAAARNSDHDPMAMVEMMIKGMNLSREMSPPAEGDPPWLGAITQGANMLGNIVEASKHRPVPPALTAATRTVASTLATAGTIPVVTPAPAAPGALPNPTAQPNPTTRGRKLPITRSELGEIVRLKNEVMKRGLQLSEVLCQIRENVAKTSDDVLLAPPTPETSVDTATPETLDATPIPAPGPDRPDSPHQMESGGAEGQPSPA